MSGLIREETRAGPVGLDRTATPRGRRAPLQSVLDTRELVSVSGFGVPTTLVGRTVWSS
jgi:hypothetical protein